MRKQGLIHLTLRCLALLGVLLAALAAAPAPAAAAGGGGILKVGVPEEPKSLNPWLATDAWSSRVVRLIYEPLYIREPKNLDLIPWLAAEMPAYDQAALTYTIKLRQAKWSDGSPLTADDVAYTVWLIQSFKIPLYYDLWDTVSKVEVLDPATIRFTLSGPLATFVSRSLATPIVQRAQWEPIADKANQADKPLAKLREAKLDKPVGTGPFKLAQWQSGTMMHLLANEHFWGRGQEIAGCKLGPHIAGILIKVFGTADAAVLGLRKGDIDFYWNAILPGYLAELEKNPQIKLYHGKKSALYYLGFNLRRPPLHDLAFRQAVAVMVDKGFIVQRILQGAGEAMTSVVPEGNVYFHNPGLKDLGQGLDKAQRIKAAYEILKKAGYSWRTPPVDAQGNPQPGAGLRDPEGFPVRELTVLTPPSDYDPNRAMAGMMVQEWLKELGIPITARPMAFSAMLKQVKNRHDFDLFVLGYGRLNLDPDYLRSFFHSKQDKTDGWNMSGYKNPVYDELADKSETEMDPARRREILFAMQKMICDDMPYLPLYNPALVEGVRADRFTGWVEMVDGIGNVFSFCAIKAK
ncbi:MAG: ABC transporter substrate-binding protein [Thermodesulfobacteriota bacterium]